MSVVGKIQTLGRIMANAGEGGGSLLENLVAVRDKLNNAITRRNIPYALNLTPRLVCVAKTKPAAVIETAYGAGQRHFGENYVTELYEKSNSLRAVCPEIKWHFIGHLQKNKVSKLLACPNLHMIETIDSEKIADKVDKAWATCEESDGSSLKVMVQVNTSNEPQKNGVSKEDVCKLVRHIKDSCPHLSFAGVMTIGSFSHDYSTGPNPDFLALLECKQKVMEEFSLNADEVEVSMGMSNDFEHAVELGSTNVRVGSTIFGARQYAAS